MLPLVLGLVHLFNNILRILPCQCHIPKQGQQQKEKTRQHDSLGVASAGHNVPIRVGKFDRGEGQSFADCTRLAADKIALKFKQEGIYIGNFDIHLSHLTSWNKSQYTHRRR